MLADCWADESTRTRFHPFHAAIQSSSSVFSQLLLQRYTSLRESPVVTTIFNNALY